MLGYTVRRVLMMIPTLLAISAIVFVIIQLPPGDYFTSYLNELQSRGESVDPNKIAFLKEQYGFDKPLYQQYLYWVGGLLHGDMGYSFEYDLPVRTVVGDRLLLTFVVSFTTILFTWLVAFPASAIIPSPSSASSAWRRRISCWRWCCNISRMSGSAPRSAG